MGGFSHREKVLDVKDRVGNSLERCLYPVSLACPRYPDLQVGLRLSGCLLDK